MSEWKQRSNKRRVERQAPAEKEMAKPRAAKKYKKPHKFKVLKRKSPHFKTTGFLFDFYKDWFKIGKTHTLEQAEKIIDKDKRMWYSDIKFEYKIQKI